ncbi:antibiotic biosynthesis monooxygenase [Rhizobium leguminosarum]|uniref:antibiotic biosynthesis monooxygenase family protein n=1 Tax=Rhizobium leguminosarum TaxID=384 RepID=UPI001C911369|nr:antibiotic biosynthesis monooxygenase family protein [Rhizobium leguminosarum]MBY2924348.1 antibiotic biosynthesis monooxygenase [Rhizobium leguminosarum]
MTTVVEVAEIKVNDPTGFESAVAAARPYFLAAEGCLDFALHRVVETPEIYRLLITWRSVEDHMVTFRASEGFKAWRMLASPYFAAPPTVTHSSAVLLRG